MTNPFVKKVPHNHAYWFIVLLLFVAYIIFWSMKYTNEPTDLFQLTTAPARAAQAIQKAIEPENSHLMHVTGFSSVECHTKWCRTHAGQPRGKQVALNFKKFGTGWSKVYVPAYDKTYAVIGATDEKTDLDIWFGDDQETALTVNTRILVNLLK